MTRPCLFDAWIFHGLELYRQLAETCLDFSRTLLFHWQDTWHLTWAVHDQQFHVHSSSVQFRPSKVCNIPIFASDHRRFVCRHFDGVVIAGVHSWLAVSKSWCGVGCSSRERSGRPSGLQCLAREPARPMESQDRFDYPEAQGLPGRQPWPCSEYGLKCCKGVCRLEGCKVLDCRKCNGKMSTVPAPWQKKICQDKQICHDTVNLDKARGCAFTVGKCASTKYSCEKCNLFYPVNEQSPVGQVSKARAACEDTTFCYYPGDKYRYADGWCQWNRAKLKCENGERTEGR